MILLRASITILSRLQVITTSLLFQALHWLLTLILGLTRITRVRSYVVIMFGCLQMRAIGLSIYVLIGVTVLKGWPVK